MYYTIYTLCTTLLNLGKHLNMVHTSSKDIYEEFYFFIFQLHKGQTVEEQLIGSCGWLTYLSDLVLL